jgi:hypothetical protein
MLEGVFSPWHLLLLLFTALIIFVVPPLLIFLLARWLDKRLLHRAGVRVSAVAVAIGGITDVVASTVLGIPLAIYFVVKYGLFHAPTGSAAIASSIHLSGPLYGLQLAIGLGCSVLGGYVAARIAKHDELLNGILSSFLCTAIGVYSALSGRESQPRSVQILLLVASPAFALLGGYLRRTQKEWVVRGA